ncbi:MAG: ankyrin repeat domain-containing protein, partial [archaeon]|nr:ankyrin repeat domain-containing protein [archaeon]
MSASGGTTSQLSFEESVAKGDEKSFRHHLGLTPALAGHVDKQGAPVLVRCISLRHPELAAVLIEEYAADLEQADLRGRRPLHVAAEEGDLETSWLLQRKGADVAAQTESGDTALHLLVPLLLSAKKEGQKPIKLLDMLQQQASEGQTRKEEAREQVIRLVEAMLKSRPELVNVRNRAGESALHLAARRNLVGAVELLLAHGAQPSLRNGDSDTPLHLAAYSKHYVVTSLLLIHGADGDVTGSRGSVKSFARHSGDLILQDILVDPQLFRKAYEAPPPSPVRLPAAAASRRGRNPRGREEERQDLEHGWHLEGGAGDHHSGLPPSAEAQLMIDGFVDIPEENSHLVFANRRKYYQFLGRLDSDARLRSALKLLWKIDKESQVPRTREVSTLSLKVLIRSGIPDNLRRAVWLSVTGTNDLYYTSDYDHWQRAQLFAFGPALCLPGPGFDIQGRLFGAEPFFTFGEHCLNLDGETWAKRVLLVLVRMNGDIDHCTPLPDAICLLLLFMNEKDAFLTAMAMLQDSRQRRWYFNLGPKNTQLFYLTFDDLLERKHSALASMFHCIFFSSSFFSQSIHFFHFFFLLLEAHFESLGLRARDYAQSWFERLFVSSLPHPSVLYVFDAYLNEGSKILYRAALAILEELKPRLLACKSKADCLNVISMFCSQLHLVKIKEIMSKAYSIYLSRSTFAALERANQWKTSTVQPFTTQQFYTPRPKPRGSSIIPFELWEKLYSHLPSRIRIMDPHLLFSNEDGYSLTGLINASTRSRRSYSCLLLIKSISPVPAIFGCYTPSRWVYKGDVSYGSSPEGFLFTNNHKSSDSPFDFYHVNPDLSPDIISQLGICFQVVNSMGLYMGIDNN